MKNYQLSFIAFLFLFSLQLNAQKVKVIETSEHVNGIKYEGVATTIQLDAKPIEKEWVKYLKTWNKLETSKYNGYTVRQAEMKNIDKEPVTIYSTISGGKSGVMIFWAIEKSNGEFIKKGEDGFESMKKMLYDFAIEQYREDMNMQIAEAEKVVQKTVKEYEKKVSEGEKLDKSLDKNAKEKADLEEKLKDNAKEREKLLQDKETNKREQEAALEDIQKVRKLAEEKKQKLLDIK
jgi:coenzyme F420-reducing hydrogenase delta subunit